METITESRCYWEIEQVGSKMETGVHFCIIYGAGIAELVRALDWLSLCCAAIITLRVQTLACAPKARHFTILASSVDRDVNVGSVDRNWLRRWFQTLNLSFTITFMTDHCGSRSDCLDVWMLWFAYLAYKAQYGDMHQDGTGTEICAALLGWATHRNNLQLMMTAENETDKFKWVIII